MMPYPNTVAICSLVPSPSAVRGENLTRHPSGCRRRASHDADAAELGAQGHAVDAFERQTHEGSHPLAQINERVLEAASCLNSGAETRRSLR